MKTEKRDIAIIPAAGLGTRFHSLGAAYPKWSLPYKGRTILEHIIHKIATDTSIRDVFVGVREGTCDLIKNHIWNRVCQMWPDLRLHWVTIRVSNTWPDGPVNTIYRCMIEAEIVVGEQIGRTLIHLSDTVFEIPLDEFLEGDAISGMWVSAGDQSRWCVLRGSGKNQVFTDKPSEPQTLSQLALSGLYSFRDSRLLRHCLSSCEGETEISKVLSRYASERASFETIVHSSSQIRDFGTLEAYRANVGVHIARPQNEVKICDHVVVKSSPTNPRKVMAEAAWLTLVRNGMYRYMFPEIISVSPQCSGYTMERIWADNLHDLALFTDTSYSTWSKIFSEFWKLECSFSNTATTVRDTSFWDGLDDRIASRGVPDKKLVTLLRKELCAALTASGVRMQTSMFHGDTHFANMFWDYRSNSLKLIDPRGDLYGHWLYDVAKLAQSVLGHFDAITEKLYVPTSLGSCYYYELERKGIQKAFFDHVITHLTESQRTLVRVVTACLYATLLPFHPDKSDQSCFIGESMHIIKSSNHEFYGHN